MTIFLVLVFQVFLFKQVASKSYCESKYEPAPIQKNAVKLLTSDKPYTEHINKKRYSEEVQQGAKLLLYVNGTKSGQEFIACAGTKAGSTRLRLLLYKILNPNFSGNFIGAVYWRDEWVGAYQLGFKKLQELLMEKDIPRYLFVRDPYTRAISMYNHKVKSKKAHQDNFLRGMGNGLKEQFKDKNLTFSQFVEFLYHRPTQKQSQINQKTPLNLHFMSQSDICGLSVGMKYNYIYKQEEINSWYDCFVQQINFADEVMHGWPGKDQCYFSTPKNPCNGPHFENSSISAANAFFEQHKTGSAGMVDEFYNNQTIIDMVTEFYLQDFVNFNYDMM